MENMKMSKHKSEPGFTLLELSVAIALGLIVGFLLFEVIKAFVGHSLACWHMPVTC